MCVCVCAQFGRSESIKALEKLILLRTHAHTHICIYIEVWAANADANASANRSYVFYY